MDGVKGIYWLASYPKSGNTWFRIVLANVLNESNSPVDINRIATGCIASSRNWIDDAFSFDSACLSHDELDQLLPTVYKQNHEQAEDVSYHKIHNAYTYIDKERKIPLIPNNGCLRAIYIIRNPLDVAISLANHFSCSIDQAIEHMGTPNFALCDGIAAQSEQVRQWLGSWSEHVQSWTKAPDMNVLILRYEDMKQSTITSFTKAMDFLQLSVTQEKLISAVDSASIAKLQEMEEKSGFTERPAKTERFFRKGIVGDWEATLSPTQIKKIIGDHAVVMNEHGYLDESLPRYF